MQTTSACVPTAAPQRTSNDVWLRAFFWRATSTCSVHHFISKPLHKLMISLNLMCQHNIHSNCDAQAPMRRHDLIQVCVHQQTSGQDRHCTALSALNAQKTARREQGGKRRNFRPGRQRCPTPRTGRTTTQMTTPAAAYGPQVPHARAHLPADLLHSALVRSMKSTGWRMGFKP